ncbi:hypothetical protein [Spirosoma spitsbergense]|uniref:hypothetical protein n=1 Tax=Spirosoma spitsbergense TaxID=431554 RepID=UPI00037904B5|nr:hypothetical protein [Spirosoma spitsbergense]
MVPTFLQKRRTAGHSLRSPIILFFLLVLIVVYITAISFIIADRTYTQSGKLATIVMLLVMALGSLGLFERLRR